MLVAPSKAIVVEDDVDASAAGLVVVRGGVDVVVTTTLLFVAISVVAKVEMIAGCDDKMAAVDEPASDGEFAVAKIVFVDANSVDGFELLEVVIAVVVGDVDRDAIVAAEPVVADTLDPIVVDDDSLVTEPSLVAETVDAVCSLEVDNDGVEPGESVEVVEDD